MILEVLLSSFSAFIGAYIGVRLGTLTAKGESLLPQAIVHAITPPAQRAEYMPPMTDDEYDAYEQANSESGSLFKKIIAKAPWTSARLNSPSSDSSSKTE